MSEKQAGTRGVYRAEDEAKLAYRVYDADNHFYETPDSVTRFLEPKYKEKFVQRERLSVMQEGTQSQTAKAMTLEKKARTIGDHAVPEGGHGGVDPTEMPEMDTDIPVPGAMLNKLNAMRGMSSEARQQLVDFYKTMEPAFYHRDDRLALMDKQGVQAAVIHTGGGQAFGSGDLELGYAATRAYNRWVQDEWGFAYKERIFVPATVPLKDVGMAVKELDAVLSEDARLINLAAGPAPLGSPFDPCYDPIWSRVNEAEVPIVLHLGGGNYQKHTAEWSEDPDAFYNVFGGFQWVTCWGDRPIMDSVTAMVFHNMFGRFPKIRVLIAEYGTVWLPYLLRKLDHGHILGRKAKWGGAIPGRPSELFKERCIVAPFPEENIRRSMDVVGTDCLVFGSDFPHSEGLPDPVQYARTIEGLDAALVKALMRDNLARFMRWDA